MSSGTTPKLGNRVGKLPFSTGEPVVINRATAAETAVLEKFNWQQGDPVPDNFAELLAQSAAAAIAESDNCIPPVPMDTPPLDVNSVVRELDQMTPAEQLVWGPQFKQNDATKSRGDDPVTRALAQAKKDLAAKQAAQQQAEEDKNYHPSVAGAMATADEATITPEDEEAAKLKLAETEQKKKDRGFTDADLQQYFVCLEAGVPFSKSYAMGKLTVTLRELSQAEMRDILVAFDALRKDGKTSADAATAFYFDARACFQLASLSGSIEYKQKNWAGGGASVADIVRAVQDSVMRNESLIRVINQRALQFDKLLRAIEAELTSENF